MNIHDSFTTDEESAIFKATIRESKRKPHGRYNESSDDEPPIIRQIISRRASRRKETRTVKTTNACEVDEVVITTPAIQRKMASIPNDRPKYNPKTTSPLTNTTVTDISSMGFVTPAKPYSEQPLCTHCDNRGFSCHNKMYSTYCTKVCLSYLQNNQDGWESGFDPSTMQQVCFCIQRKTTCRIGR